MSSAKRTTERQAAAVESYGEWSIARDQIDAGILGMLAKGPKPRKELQAAFGGDGSSPARVVNSVKRLIKGGQIERCEEGYRLKGEAQPKPKRSRRKQGAK